jgi:transposase
LIQQKLKYFQKKDQKDKIDLWMDDVIDVYNLTNQYIKDNNLSIKDVNFYKLRKILKDDIQEICSRNKLNKHTADYSVKHCVEMYKSAFSNRKSMDKFEIKDLLKSKRRKNLVLEPITFSKKNNGFLSLGDMRSSLKFKDNVKSNSILQYDSYRKRYIIITPHKKKIDTKCKKYDKCGIDIGVRTFLTIYSKKKSYEIGTDTNKIIDSYCKRTDNIKSSYDKNIINEKKKKDLLNKYQDKMNNKISDLHNKSASFVLKRYKNVNIGNVSIKKMISNLTGNLKEIVKRRLVTLSHYRFRMKLISMSIKSGSNINEIDEYMTSKKCCNCNNIKDNLGSNKTYRCKKCNIILDRDINASINIYKI